MTIEEFVAKWTGKGIDFDGAYGDQCMDLMHQYCVEVLGLTDGRILAAPGAKDVFLNYSAIFGNEHFDKIDNTPMGVPQKGDIMFWGTGIGKYGHVALFEGGDASKFTSFDQNWNGHQYCETVPHTYTSVLGWLHPKPHEVVATITQAEVDQLRADRDKNWNLYQEEQKKGVELEKQLREKQDAINTLNDKVRLLNEAMAKDALEDHDQGILLIRTEGELKDLHSEADDVAFKLGVAPWDHARIIEAIDKLKQPVEEVVKPMVKEHQQMYKLLFEDGLGVYKRFRPQAEGIVNKLRTIVISIVKRIVGAVRI